MGASWTSPDIKDYLDDIRSILLTISETLTEMRNENISSPVKAIPKRSLYTSRNHGERAYPR